MEDTETDETFKKIQELKEIFDYFDKDRSGDIDTMELLQLFSCIGESPVQEEIEEMLHSMDQDGNGKIS